MKLSTKGRYAVMALVDLAVHGQGKPIVIADIAARQGLSPSYLEQLFGRLRKSGLVQSVRGQSGGYLLGKQPEDISISCIFEAVDEPIKTTACQPGHKQGCSGTSERCITHHLWAGLSQVIEKYLRGVTLAHVCANPRNPLPSFTEGAL